MKQSLSVILSLLFPFLAVCQGFFTVNVGTFVEAKTVQFDDIRPLGFVYAYEMEGNLSQVYLGGFDDKAKADQVAAAIQQKGYRSAYVEERSLSQGQTVTVIQLATRETDKLIEWQQFENVGPLYGILNGNYIKIVTGIYPDINAAKQALPAFRNGPFRDAFIKNVNNTILIHINEFETGIKKPLIPINVDPQANAANNNPNIPAQYDAPAANRMQTRGSGTTPAATTIRDPGPMAANLPRTKTVTKTPPNIRPDVKRRSVLELQKVLKAEKAYSSSLDGYYGPGTDNGYNLYKQNDPTYKKYMLLSEHYAPNDLMGNQSRLQLAINHLLDDPTAPLTVENSPEAIAKAYKAYLLFQTMGPSTDVNALMNEAIQLSFKGPQGSYIPAFDYNATYAYQDLDQLILHMHYLHAAPSNDIAIPCWLYEEHPQETGAAHAAFARFNSESFKLQVCDQFMNWEEIKVLEVIAADLNADARIDEKKIATYASARAQLFLTPRALDADEIKIVEQWNDQMWANLNAWAAKDPLHQKMSTALKVAYFHSQIRLEDYYMNEGFNQEEAKGLALATLKTIVGYPLERFV